MKIAPTAKPQAKLAIVVAATEISRNININ
jgi:hypothetical protein